MGNKDSKPKAPPKSASDQMFDMIFEFKMQGKQMLKESKRAEMDEQKLKLKVKHAIENNMPEAAKIHAADAIRKKHEARRLLVLSSKLDAVQSRLSSAYKTNQVKNI